MKKTNKNRVKEFIRVDHAGERGAIKIYEGQLLALNTFIKDDDLKKKIEQMKVHEKEHCDYFMVFLQRDPSETRFTKYKPVIPLYERYKTLMAIKYIDEVVTYQTEEDLIKLMEFYKPDIRILGDDYIGKRFTGDHLPIEVIYTTRCHEWSTTKIKDLITKQTILQNPEILNKS